MKVYDNKEDQGQGRKTRDDIHLVRACELYMLGGIYGDSRGRYPGSEGQDEN